MSDNKDISGVELQQNTVDGNIKSRSTENGLNAIVSNELTRIGTNRSWVWKLFFLCVTPNILNGFHVSSYVFIGQMPQEHWCVIPQLKAANWTSVEIQTISSNDAMIKGCQIYDRNYEALSKMTYLEALNFTQQDGSKNIISCSQYSGSYQNYVQPDGLSIVTEWNLVCENSVWRTTVQVAVSIGKFLGATTFGIISDRYGRKTSFILGSAFYIAGSVLTSFSPWYWLFLVGRFALGSSSSGLFYPAFSILSENIDVSIRSWMSVAFSMSYPVGMLILALLANFIHQWRSLQLALTIPAFCLILYCYFLKESPRWLISKGRNEEAYRILFKKKKDIEFPVKIKCVTNEALQKTEKKSTFTKFKNSFIELSSLYGPGSYRRMAIICHYTWCVTSLSYYVTALNADNLAANRVVYVAATGGVDILGISLSIFLLRIMGRKPSICCLFALAGSCLLALLGIGNSTWIVSIAMLARFGITAVYAIVTLHTAEMFPTDIRNSALGTSSMCAHIGSIAAPYIVDFLGIIGWYIPTTICGVLIVLAGLMALTQPETKSSSLQDKVKRIN